MLEHDCEYTSVCCGVGAVDGTDLDGGSYGMVGFCGSCHDGTAFECMDCEEQVTPSVG